MRQIQPRRAEFEKIVANDQQSFHWHHLVCKQFTAPYHYHPEYELIHICRGRGSRLVSDSIKHFGPGDLVFIAPNVPHIWQVSPECPEAETLYIQFLPEFLGAEFFKTPEMQTVWELMITARNGAGPAVRPKAPRMAMMRLSTMDTADSSRVSNAPQASSSRAAHTAAN